MNSLEKLYNLLNNDTRKIVYGKYNNETEDNVIVLKNGESKNTISVLNDKAQIEYPIYIVQVYSKTFLSGYDLLNTIKEEIKLSVKTTMKVVHLKDYEVEINEDISRFIFKSEFKEIKI